MAGEKITKDIAEKLKIRKKADMGYDNYRYVDSGGQYADNDADHSETDRD